MSETFEQIKKKLLAPKKPKSHLPYDEGLSSGSTLINLACSGRADVAFLPGYYYLWVGDSGSGKTFITLTTLAEAANNQKYKDYRLIFDQPERGALMDFRRYFGERMAKRIEGPSVKHGEYSSTVEEFYYNVDRAIDRGPCIYLLDSMDALVPKDDREKFNKGRNAHEKGKELATGSYGTAKARVNSSSLRVVHNRLTENGSILIVISQTRENIGFDAMFNPKTRGGGKALTFYAALELWTSVKGHLKKNVNGKDREQGVVVKVRVKKGRLAGKDRTVEVPIYHSLGIDDLGSCVDYLVEEGHWREVKGKIEAKEFGTEGNREALVRYIEEGGQEGLLWETVGKAWAEIEAKCEVKRKNRYQ